MSVHTRKHHTSGSKRMPASMILISDDGHIFRLPKEVFASYIEKYEVRNTHMVEKIKNSARWNNALDPGEVFAELNAKYTKLGALVKGIRYRENLNQTEFAEQIEISQSDLSKIENGKRPIGRNLSKRIINKFKLSPNIFNSFLSHSNNSEPLKKRKIKN